MSGETQEKRFTGRHMAMILVAFFGVVIAVNLTMATLATTTFGGLVVDNSYVASQKFNGWLEQAREEAALGWDLEVTRGETGRVEATLSTHGQAMPGARIIALARHPLGRWAERSLTFEPLGDGHYRSVEMLPAGRWVMHVRASMDGRAVNRLVDLQ